MALVPLKMNDVCKETRERLKVLQDAYQTAFQAKPFFCICSPGRVNLIGEHIDYNGFSVLPIAIEKDILVAVGPNDESLINIFNVNEKNYPHIAIHFKDIPSEIDLGTIAWYHYIFAGLLGVSQEYKLENVSLNMMVSGDLLPAAGLSSSSALVCASALAVVFKYHLHENSKATRQKLATLCATAEYYVGTRGGGMDQAVILLAEKGYALKIDFNPLKTKNIPLPEGLSFIVAHSGVKAEKAKSGDFNKRVAECKLAAKVLAKKAGEKWDDVNTLSELLTRLKKSPESALDLMNGFLHDKAYTSASICEILEISMDELKTILQGYQLGSLESLEFELVARAKHVYQEVNNVEKFIASCESKDLRAMGSAMTASHNSLKNNYGCSHPNLDALVEVALNSGALGARLTGAGFGGCVIALTTKDKEHAVEEALKGHVEKFGLSRDSVFSTCPSAAATVIEITDEN